MTADGLSVGAQLAKPRFADALVLHAAGAFLAAYQFASTTPDDGKRLHLARLWPLCSVAERVGYAVLEGWPEFPHV